MSKRKKTRRRQIKQVVTFNITHFPFIARTRQTGLATIEADLGGVGLLAIYWDSGEAEKENNERVQSFEVPSKRCCWKVGENSAPCPHLDHLWYRGVASQLRSSGTQVHESWMPVQSQRICRLFCLSFHLIYSFENCRLY